MDWLRRHSHTFTTVVLTAIIVALALILIIVVWDIGEEIEIDSVSDAIYLFGFLFLAGSLLALIGLAAVALFKVLRAKATKTVDGDKTFELTTFPVDLPAIIKEIAAAPL